MPEFTPVKFNIDTSRSGDQLIYNQGFQIVGGCCNRISFRRAKKAERTVNKLCEVFRTNSMQILATAAQEETQVRLDRIKEEKRLITLDECQELASAMNRRIAECHHIFEYLKLIHFFDEESPAKEIDDAAGDDEKDAQVTFASSFDDSCELSEKIVLKCIDEIKMIPKLEGEFRQRLAKQVFLDLKEPYSQCVFPIKIKEQAAKYLKKEYSLYVIEKYFNKDLLEAVKSCDSPDELDEASKNILMRLAIA